MSWDDEPTPLLTPNEQMEFVAIKTQLDDLRLDFELQRPIVEMAKVLSDRWDASGGKFNDSVANAIDMLFRMVEAARSVRGE